ncbi:MAG: 50S ribosomal protein L29 [Chlamydiae bacterium RIFCSPHIGHO2_12_FULL_49_11]|nr:MAG: 50S ribosomal protein L29 [Chlamydiae bacterium RIFCSPHIGHO2_12_FULL_49_11]
MVTFEELKNFDEKELETTIGSLSKELVKLRIEANRQKKVDKPHLFVLTRKRIAQAKTLLNAKARV